MVEEVIDFSTLKKTKPQAKKPKTDTVREQPSTRDAQYKEMLTRVFLQLRQSKTLPTEQKSWRIRQPEVVRIGTNKSAWINFQEICDILRRTSEHLSRFVFVELGTDGSIVGDQQLVLKGRYLSKHIEHLLRKYMNEYVLCQMCKSMNTALSRDPSIRLYTMKCDNCGSSRSVQQIKEGYHAVNKVDRKKEKMKST
jgi:translation initiation factor 2 subunit 2